MGCCESNNYRADGCLARSCHCLLDVVTIACVIAIICLTAFSLTEINPDACYLDGQSGYGDLARCTSIYIVAGISMAIWLGTVTLHCFTCCFTRLGFLVEALGETAQAVIWALAAVTWARYATDTVQDPDASPEFISTYDSLASERDLVILLAWVVMGCQVFQACIAVYRAVAACCCGKESEDKYAA